VSGASQKSLKSHRLPIYYRDPAMFRGDWGQLMIVCLSWELQHRGSSMVHSLLLTSSATACRQSSIYLVKCVVFIIAFPYVSCHYVVICASQYPSSSSSSSSSSVFFFCCSGLKGSKPWLISRSQLMIQTVRKSVQNCWRFDDTHAHRLRHMYAFIGRHTRRRKLKTKKRLELHSVKRIPLPGWTVYVLYPTDRPDLYPDLHQKWIILSLSRTQPVHKVSSESVHNFLRYPAHR